MKTKYLIIIILFASCSKDFRASRKISKLQSWGYLKEKSDTVWQTIVIPADTVEISIGAEVDTLYLDSVLRTINDTCIGKKRIKDIARNIPCTADPVYYEDALFKISAILKDLKIELEVIRKEAKEKTPQIISTTTVNDPEKCNHWKFWLAICLLGAAVLGLIFKRVG